MNKKDAHGGCTTLATRKRGLENTPTGINHVGLHHHHKQPRPPLSGLVTDMLAGPKSAQIAEATARLVKESAIANVSLICREEHFYSNTKTLIVSPQRGDRTARTDRTNPAAKACTAPLV